MWSAHLRFVAGLAAFGLLLPLREAFADEDNIPDTIVVEKSSTTIAVPYEFGNVYTPSLEIVKPVPIRQSQQLIVAGKKVGSTNITIFDQKGVLRDVINVSVIPAALARVYDNIQTVLGDIEGLSYKVIGNQIYVQGEVSLEDELQKVAAVAKREKLVESMVRLSPVSQRLLANLIEKEIGTPGVTVRLLGDAILLDGVVHSAMSSKRAQAIADAYYPSVINVLEVRESDRVPGRTETVTVIVHFLELTKSLLNSWGVEWTPLSTSGGVDFGYYQDAGSDGWGDVTGYASATMSALLPKLQRAKTSGYARVLDNPSVAVKSGDQASIFSGVEYPVAVVQPNGGVTVDWKNVGISMSVTPFAQGGDVDLVVDVETSSLGEVAPNGLQSIDTSSISTSEYCRSGESIVIGGLQRVSDRITYNRIPDAASVEGSPLITLYKSKDYKKTKSQFLVFITPQVHETTKTANQELQDKFNLLEVRQ
jgi:pilus assembly protein CpaC